MANSLHDCLSKCILNQTYLTELVKSCILECVPPQPQLQPSEKYKAPLVWIGLYVAGASLVCMFLMAADFINGLLTKKYWFPCKFFTLNAAISAVLAISLKMPSDLTTLMPSGRDQLMKLCGTTLMSVSMANFMPSLADMSVAELFANLISLAVFIVPLVSNICIQIGTGVISKTIAVEHVIIIVCITLQFAFLIFTALISTTVKKCFKSIYKGVFDHFQGERTLKIHYIRSLWINSNTQFVVARYITSIASGAICLVSVVVLAEVALQLYVPLSKKHTFFHPNSDYQWSSKFIVVAQLAAILVGSISPLYRWFKVVWLNFSGLEQSSFKDFVIVQQYWWSKRLIELNNFPIGLNTSNADVNRLIHNSKDTYVYITLLFHILTTILCIILCAVSLFLSLPFFFFYKMICMFCCEETTANVAKENLDLKELELISKGAVNEINDLANDYINKRIDKAKSMKLVELLEGAREFDGIKEFNSIFIQRLTKIKVYNHPNGNNWTLRVATLSIIAYAIKPEDSESYVRSNELPGENKFVTVALILIIIRLLAGGEEDEFVSMVNNILGYVSYIEKTVDVDQDDIGIGDAAMDLWHSIFIQNSKMVSISSSLKTKLENLIELSEEYIEHNQVDKLRVETGNWMKETVEVFIEFLDSEKGKEIENKQQLFNKISQMIADIFIACSVNLTKAISINMLTNPIEKKVTINHEISTLIETDPIIIFIDEKKSIIVGSPAYREYKEESWWKFVIPTIEDNADHNHPQRELQQPTLYRQPSSNNEIAPYRQPSSNNEIVPYEEEE